MVGSAIARRLKAVGQTNIVTGTRAELDLTDQRAVHQLFANEEPTEVYLPAAKVGSIHADKTIPAGFIYDNLMVQLKVVHAAHDNEARNLLFLGSSCIYPRMAAPPMAGDSLLTGTLEPTNEPCAIAKNAGIKTDPSKPEGMPRKMMENARMKGLGWAPAVSLKRGIRLANEDFKKNQLETA